MQNCARRLSANVTFPHGDAEISCGGEQPREEKRGAVPRVCIRCCTGVQLNVIPDLHRWIVGVEGGGGGGGRGEGQIAHLKELNVAWQQKTLSEVEKVNGVCANKHFLFSPQQKVDAF